MRNARTAAWLISSLGAAILTVASAGRVWEATHAPAEGSSVRLGLFSCASAGGGCDALGSADVLRPSDPDSAASVDTFAWAADPTPLTAKIPPVTPESASSVLSEPQFSPSGTQRGLERLGSGEGLVRVSDALVGALVQPVAEPPQQLFAAVDEAATELILICASETMGSSEALACWTRDGPARYTAIDSSAGSDETRSRLELPDGTAADVEKAAVILMLHRLVHQQQIKSEEASALASNESRMSASQGYVAGLYFLLALATVLLAVMAAALFAWALPMRSRRPVRALLAWMVLVLPVTVIVSAAGGLAGWIAMASLLALAILSTGSAAIVLSRRKHKQTSPGNSEVVAMPRPVDPEKSMMIDIQGGTPTGKAPHALTRWQVRLLCGCLIALLLIATLLPALAFTWTVQPYVIWDRTTGAEMEEFQPQTVAKGLLMAYGFDSLAVTLRLGWMLSLLSDTCGETYSAQLTGPEKDVAILEEFVEKYSIDMSMYEPSDYREYSTVNEWFSRPLAPGVRLVAPEPYVVSPADARVVVYPTVPEDLRVWLKSQYFSVEELLDGTEGYEELKGGSLAIVRLAPQDYHRFHSHMSGTVLQHVEVEGPLYSVFADAIRAENGAIFNQRTVSVLQRASGQLSAFISIGATCVGSVVMSTEEGESVEAGQEFGLFQFGGSTVVVVFPPGAIEFDSDLVQRSAIGLETYLHMGQRIGRWL